MNTTIMSFLTLAAIIACLYLLPGAIDQALQSASSAAGVDRAEIINSLRK